MLAVSDSSVAEGVVEEREVRAVEPVERRHLLRLQQSVVELGQPSVRNVRLRDRKLTQVNSCYGTRKVCSV